MAYRVGGDEAFLAAALTNLDYLLGRNATGYSFVTGLGSKSPKNIHHRQSGADGIKDPVPGLLAGGPNPNQEDKGSGVVYPSNLPARSFVDVQGSYASNEICINWNAPMAYAACAIEAIMAEQGRAEGSRVEDNVPLVETIALLPSYPNPFNANTTLRWRLEDDAFVEVIVYNVRGERAAILVQEQQSRGEHVTVWRADGLPTGIYVVVLKAGERMVRQKVMLVK
jgi:endoglucanase